MLQRLSSKDPTKKEEYLRLKIKSHPESKKWVDLMAFVGEPSALLVCPQKFEFGVAKAELLNPNHPQWKKWKTLVRACGKDAVHYLLDYLGKEMQSATSGDVTTPPSVYTRDKFWSSIGPAIISRVRLINYRYKILWIEDESISDEEFERLCEETQLRLELGCKAAVVKVCEQKLGLS